MVHWIVGTAGHVDHGKTELIKALTGVDTDRLREEKERGISIELGFAPLTLPSGQTAGVVDVPGHEDFIHHMLAGVAGIDLVLLVIAADEGVMPQTREHLAIINLLQIRRGIVVISKTDLVDRPWLELVEEEVRDTLQGTVLAGSPLVEVSALAGRGLDDLLQAIQEQLEGISSRTVQGRGFRLPIDRLFLLKGFGTVAAGTLWEGIIHTGDGVEILPPGLKARVRGLQVHGREVREALAGQRVAVNLSGIDREQISRGQVLVSPGYLRPATRMDVHLTLIQGARSLKHGARIRFHLATAELLGRVLLLDRESLEPGETALAQVVMESPGVGQRGDRFIIRSYSPMRVIGGGQIIGAEGIRRKRYDRRALESLSRIMTGQPEVMLAELASALSRPVALKEVPARINLEEEAVSRAAARLADQGVLLPSTAEGEQYLVDARYFQHWQDQLLEFLGGYTRQFPLRGGASREEVRTRLAPALRPAEFNALLSLSRSAGSIEVRESQVAPAGYQPNPGKEWAAALAALEEIYLRAELNPPAWPEALAPLSLSPLDPEEIQSFMVQQGRLVKIAEGLLLHPSAVEKAREKIVAFLQQNPGLTMSQARDLLNTSRRYALPLMEYFDRLKVTRRKTDCRVPY